MLDVRSFGLLEDLTWDELSAQLGVADSSEFSEGSFEIGGRYFSSDAAALLQERLPVLGRTVHYVADFFVEYALQISEGGTRYEIFSFDPRSGLSTYSEIAVLNLLMRGVPADELQRGHYIFSGPTDVSRLEGAVCIASCLARCRAAVATRWDGAHLKIGNASGVFISKCLFSAFGIDQTKYRYLEIYRAIESLYLTNIKDYLDANFGRSPHSAVAEATRMLASEAEQIAALASNRRVRDDFEFIAALVDELAQKGNRFASALSRKIGQRREDNSTLVRKGAAYVYAIRCAIVHAGVIDLRYDSSRTPPRCWMLLRSRYLKSLWN